MSQKVFELASKPSYFMANRPRSIYQYSNTDPRLSISF